MSEAIAMALDNLAVVVARQTETLARIDARLTVDAEVRVEWARVADALDAFRLSIEGSQRRTAEALVHGRRNALASQEAADQFTIDQREAVAVERRKQIGLAADDGPEGQIDG